MPNGSRLLSETYRLVQQFRLAVVFLGCAGHRPRRETDGGDGMVHRILHRCSYFGVNRFLSPSSSSPEEHEDEMRDVRDDVPELWGIRCGETGMVDTCICRDVRVGPCCMNGSGWEDHQIVQRAIDDLPIDDGHGGNPYYDSSDGSSRESYHRR